MSRCLYLVILLVVVMLGSYSFFAAGAKWAECRVMCLANTAAEIDR